MADQYFGGTSMDPVLFGTGNSPFDQAAKAAHSRVTIAKTPGRNAGKADFESEVARIVAEILPGAIRAILAEGAKRVPEVESPIVKAAKRERDAFEKARHADEHPIVKAARRAAGGAT